jgi:hypothetical protein
MKYRYSSVQQVSDQSIWTTHIQTNDPEEARNEAEIDHQDHPERNHGVVDRETNTLVFRLAASREQR